MNDTKKASVSLGKLLYEKYYTEKDNKTPKVSATGISYAYPAGISAEEKEHLDAYFKKLREDEQNKGL